MPTIQTLEDEYEYRMRKVVKEYCRRNSITELDSEQLQDHLWKEENAVEFAHMVLDDMNVYGGDEIFERS